MPLLLLLIAFRFRFASFPWRFDMPHGRQSAARRAKLRSHRASHPCRSLALATPQLGVRLAASPFSALSTRPVANMQLTMSSMLSSRNVDPVLQLSNGFLKQHDDTAPGRLSSFSSAWVPDQGSFGGHYLFASSTRASSSLQKATMALCP